MIYIAIFFAGMAASAGIIHLWARYELRKINRANEQSKNT